jgi:hypothetical protein
MCENVNINVSETNETINIVSSEIQEVIDINVFETTEDVTLNITEQLIQVNINKVTSAAVTNTSELINDGEDGVHPFITANDIPPVTGFVPYTGATDDVNLGTHDLTATQGTFATSGNPDTLTVNHSSGSGKALTITKGGAGEGIYVNKTSGSGNAVTIVGGLEATNLKRTGGTSSQFLKADGSVDSNTYFELPALTSGSVLFSNGTDIAQDNSQFFWDNTNKRLCLGTNTSVTGSALSISSAAQSNIKLIDTTNNASLNLGVGNFDASISSNGRLFLQSSTTLSVGTTNVGIGIASATLAKFHVVGTVLFSAGNVVMNSTSGNTLIGTTTDAGYKLDVNGTARINTLTIGLGSGQIASNTVLGLNALKTNTTGGANTAIGNTAMFANTTGYNNTAIGFASLYSNRTGFSNTAIGLQALYANQTASSNTAIGTQSLNGLTSGNGNLSLAASSAQKISSGATLTSATNSIFIGRDTRANANAETNQIVIGDTAIGAGSNSATLGNTSIADTILRGRINLQQYETGSRPTYVKGALIYDSTLGKLVVGGASGWEVVTSV